MHKQTNKKSHESFDLQKRKLKKENKESSFSEHFTDQKITSSVILSAAFGASGAELSLWIRKVRTYLF